MRRAFLWILAAEVLVVLILPALLVRGFDLQPRPSRPESKGIPSAVNVKVLVHSTGRIEEIPLEEYVLGVVAAEMPASFGMEALKAQAVAARTYVAKRMTAFGGPGCPERTGADICTDPNHAQGWISLDEMKRLWGVFDFERYYARLEEAVSS
ncbi:MAG: SpoIID/LytB domain-containing protein, partial [Bacillota bacterium]